MQKWRKEALRNLPLAEVAEVGEVTLMLNQGAVTHLKLAWAFGVCHVCTKQRVYGARITTALTTLAKNPLWGVSNELEILFSLRDLSLRIFPLLHPALPESFPFSCNQKAAALPSRCLQRLCNVCLASNWQKTVTPIEVLECLLLHSDWEVL